MSDDKPLVELLDEIEADIASRDDSNAMHAACGEYNCDCHYMVPRLVRELRRVTTPPPTTTEDQVVDQNPVEGCKDLPRSTVVVPQDRTSDASLIEELAALAHYEWATWMRYLFDRTITVGDDCEEIQAADVRRWMRQIQTPYCELSESEKESDRAVARRLLAAFSITQATASASAPSTTVPDHSPASLPESSSSE